MTHPPPNSRAPGDTLGPTAHVTDPAIRELLDLIAGGVHAVSHHLGLIAADVHHMREAWDRHEATLSAWERGGKLAAWTAARNARRHPNDDSARTGPGGPDGA
jgi:hypothetical protein